MNKLVAFSRIVGLIIVLGLVPAVPALAHDDDHPKLVVDDDRIQCPSAGFTTIQAAVNAARKNGKIRVCAGTYREQLTIDKPVKITGDNGAVLVPPAGGMTSNAMDLVTASPIAAAVLVRGTKHVTIERLTIDGTNNGITSCNPTLVGILFQNASGEVEDIVVRKFLTASPESCGSGRGGHGILVQSGAPGRSKVEVTNSSIHDFEQSGIRGEQPGTDIRVKENVVTGSGPAPVFSQRGIEISFGATGSIEENTVVGYSFDGCLPLPDPCDFPGTPIEVFFADGVTISKNIVGNSQQGISVVADDSKVEGNAIFSIDTQFGILFFGSRNKAENNTITNAGSVFTDPLTGVTTSTAGVLLFGDRNKVTGNKFNEAPIGVWNLSGTGNVVEGNKFRNTPRPVRTGP